METIRAKMSKLDPNNENDTPSHRLTIEIEGADEAKLRRALGISESKPIQVTLVEFSRETVTLKYDSRSARFFNHSVKTGTLRTTFTQRKGSRSQGRLMTTIPTFGTSPTTAKVDDGYIIVSVPPESDRRPPRQRSRRRRSDGKKRATRRTPSPLAVASEPSEEGAKVMCLLGAPYETTVYVPVFVAEFVNKYVKENG